MDIISHTPLKLRCIPDLNIPARQQLSSVCENLTLRQARIDLLLIFTTHSDASTMTSLGLDPAVL